MNQTNAGERVLNPGESLMQSHRRRSPASGGALCPLWKASANTSGPTGTMYWRRRVNSHAVWCRPAPAKTWIAWPRWYPRPGREIFNSFWPTPSGMQGLLLITLPVKPTLFREKRRTPALGLMKAGLKSWIGCRLIRHASGWAAGEGWQWPSGGVRRAGRWPVHGSGWCAAVTAQRVDRRSQALC